MYLVQSRERKVTERSECLRDKTKRAKKKKKINKTDNKSKNDIQKREKKMLHE